MATPLRLRLNSPLDQVTLDNTNLAVVEWDLVPVLGDELRANEAREAKEGQAPGDPQGTRKTRQDRAEDYAAAARAYRLLAVELQDQGLGDVAARYSYRAQIMQRKRRWHEHRWGAYFSSAFLALFAGYGYKRWRVLAVYAALVLAFAALYAVFGLPQDPRPYPWDYLLVSVTAIHGRVFFEQFGIHSPLSWIAAGESVCGIVIESIFAAVLIQRLFSR